ncbi:MAG TPA: hypothetical protein DEH78_26040 [Solibacterales bacterium]|nr:hypothetical protein [Bryobacterales bacterium]
MFALCWLAAVAAGAPYLVWQAEIAAADRLAAQSQFTAAEDVSRRALALAEGLGRPALAAVSENNLGSHYHEWERYGDAEKHYRRALALWATVPAAPRGRLRTLNNLASLYLATGQPARAAQLLPSPEDSTAATPEAAALLSNLAACEYARHHYREARAHYARSLAMVERLGLPVEAAIARLNLALVAFAAGRRAAAEAEALASLEFLQANLGEAHPLTGQAHLSVAMVLEPNPMQAEPHLRAALAIAERTLGPESPAAARALTAYAEMLKRAKRKSEAKTMERRAAEIRRQFDRYGLTRHTVDWAELTARARK